MKTFVHVFKGIPMYLVVSDDGTSAGVMEPVTGFTAKAGIINSDGPRTPNDWARVLSDDFSYIRQGFFKSLSEDISKRLEKVLNG